MSSCEKCWANATRRSLYAEESASEIYRELISGKEMCSAEEMAGLHATVCPDCDRRTLHQHTDECMNKSCVPILDILTEASTDDLHAEHDEEFIITACKENTSST